MACGGISVLTNPKQGRYLVSDVLVEPTDSDYVVLGNILFKTNFQVPRPLWMQLSSG